MATICPPPSLCTDNGVMIAWNGLERWRAKKGIVDFRSSLEVGVVTRVPLGEDWHPLIEKAGIKCKWIKIWAILIQIDKLSIKNVINTKLKEFTYYSIFIKVFAT